MFHNTAQSLLTSKTSTLSQSSVTAGNGGNINEEIEGIGLCRFMDLEAGILESTLKKFRGEPRDRQLNQGRGTDTKGI